MILNTLPFGAFVLLMFLYRGLNPRLCSFAPSVLVYRTPIISKNRREKETQIIHSSFFTLHS